MQQKKTKRKTTGDIRWFSRFRHRGNADAVHVMRKRNRPSLAMGGFLCLLYRLPPLSRGHADLPAEHRNQRGVAGKTAGIGDDG